MKINNILAKKQKICYTLYMRKKDNQYEIPSEAKILLLSCCAPCSVEVIERLKKEGQDFSVLFYNPNIFPFEEYQKRLMENKNLCQKEGVSFIELPWERDIWCIATQGLENEPEKGRRCDKCFALRLKKAVDYAKQKGFTHFTSVLGVSRYKNFEQVTSIALQIANEADLPYISTNWRKNGGEDRRAFLAKEKNLYHQTYCGCKPR